jgi:hypothetical protein
MAEWIGRTFQGQAAAGEAGTLGMALEQQKAINPVENMAIDTLLGMAPQLAQSNRRMRGRGQEAMYLGWGHGLGAGASMAFAESMMGQADLDSIMGARGTPSAAFTAANSRLDSLVGRQIQAASGMKVSGDLSAGRAKIEADIKAFDAQKAKMMAFAQDPLLSNEAMAPGANRRFSEGMAHLTKLGGVVAGHRTDVSDPGGLNADIEATANEVVRLAPKRKQGLASMALGFTEMGLTKEGASQNLLGMWGMFGGRGNEEASKRTLTEVMAIGVARGLDQHFGERVGQMALQEGASSRIGRYGESQLLQAASFLTGGMANASPYDLELGHRGMSKLDQVMTGNQYYSKVGIASNVRALNDVMGPGGWAPIQQAALGLADLSELMTGNATDVMGRVFGSKDAASSAMKKAGRYRIENLVNQNAPGMLAGRDVFEALRSDQALMDTASISIAKGQGMSQPEAEAALRMLAAPGISDKDRAEAAKKLERNGGGSADTIMNTQMTALSELMKELPNALSKIAQDSKEIKAYFDSLRRGVKEGNITVGSILEVQVTDIKGRVSQSTTP